MATYDLDDFAFDLRASLATPETWVTSGWSTVATVPGTVCGVGACFAPPFAAPDMRLTIELTVDGDRVADPAARGIAGHGDLLLAEARWHPTSIHRRGTYHHYRNGREVSLSVATTLTPLHGQAGYVLELAIRNRSPATISVSAAPRLDPGGPRYVPLAEWGWMQPDPGEPAHAAGPRLWTASADVRVELAHDDLAHDLPPGATAHLTVVVRFGQSLAPLDHDLRGLTETTRKRWMQLADRTLDRVPRLSSDVDGLEPYWRRSLVSGLVCLWDNPAFAVTPFPATSGIDGGAVCAYAWDTGGYAPHTLSLMLGERAAAVLDAIVAADLTTHYAIAPDGSGIGVPYAYSGWSLVTFAAAIAAQQGIDADRVRRLHDAVLALDGHFAAAGELRDYGTQHNLLEMRGAGWEHVVASPNAELASSLETLASLSSISGAGLPADDLTSRAASVRSAVASQLWDPAAGWFRSRYPDGHTELVYSIQAYDAFRAGVRTPDMAAAMIARLRPGVFLGDFGVSGVAADDERHYELGDIDWSGTGAYTGEAPQLALTLWEHGDGELAWEVMRRLLWMGRHFPYYPQEHYCDRPGTPPYRARANVIAGLTGAEAILTGMAGVRPQVDGSLVVNPSTAAPGTVELTGLGFRDRTIDITLSPDHCRTVVNGETVHDGRPRRHIAVAPSPHDSQSTGQTAGSA